MLPVFFVPHPPLAVPEVGRGQQYRIEATLKGLREIALEIGRLAPETLIYVTPHGNAFRDAVAILYEETLRGDLSAFGAFDTEKRVGTDMEMCEAIYKALEAEGQPCVLLDRAACKQYNCECQLDHGVLVPMHYIDQVYSAYSMIHLTTGFQSAASYYEIGRIIRKVIDKSERKAAVICSGDMSHALIEEGPYAYNPEGKIYDRLVKEAIEAASIDNLLAIDDHTVEGAAQCGYRSFALGFGIAGDDPVIGSVYSYEGPFGVGYLTGSLKEKQEV